MATPLTANKLLEVLAAEGVKPIELPGWRSHHRRGSWKPRAFMLHYTAGNYGANPGDKNHDARARAYAGPGGILWDGRAGVPGPLCHFGIDKEGQVWLTGWGRANHAGRVNGSAITMAEKGTLPLKSTMQAPKGDNLDGNAAAYGIEMMTASAPTAAQLEAAIKVMAAVLRAHKWPGTRVIGHGEATRRKTGDPRNVNMGQVRKDVTALLASKPSKGGGFHAPDNSTSKPNLPATGVNDQEDEDMAEIVTFINHEQSWNNFGGENWVAITPDGQGFSFLEGADRPVTITVSADWESADSITGAAMVHRVNAADKWKATGQVARDNISGKSGSLSATGVVDLNVGKDIRDSLRVILDTTPTKKMTLRNITVRAMLMNKKKA